MVGVGGAGVQPADEAGFPEGEVMVGEGLFLVFGERGGVVCRDGVEGVFQVVG